jgi:hypothetical protein
MVVPRGLAASLPRGDFVMQFTSSTIRRFNRRLDGEPGTFVVSTRAQTRSDRSIRSCQVAILEEQKRE